MKRPSFETIAEHQMFIDHKGKIRRAQQIELLKMWAKRYFREHLAFTSTLISLYGFVWIWGMIGECCEHRRSQLTVFPARKVPVDLKHLASFSSTFRSGKK